jgi:hypothetical protein
MFFIPKKSLGWVVGSMQCCPCGFYTLFRNILIMAFGYVVNKVPKKWFLLIEFRDITIFINKFFNGGILKGVMIPLW